MKKSDDKFPVDKYFQQHEADISVSYDPADWTRLAAELDAVADKTIATNPGAKAQRFRGKKGWWVTGLWLLLLLTSAWGGWKQALPKTVPETPLAAPASESMNQPGNQQPAHAVSAEILEKGKVDRPNLSVPKTTPPDARKPESVVPNLEADFTTETINNTDSMRVQPKASIPVDSVLRDSLPVKKKQKNLFW